jgi:primosomal replication protein N
VVLTLQRFALVVHVLDDPVAPQSPAWVQMDNVVISWLHGTITVELQDSIHDQSDTARQAWLALEGQFLGNREARALHLDAQFHLFSHRGNSRWMTTTAR